MSGKPVAIVTGVSSGIGLATAQRLVSGGYIVYGTSRSAARDSLAGVTTLKVDVTDDASVLAAIAEVFGKEGRIDLLVNNAGIGIAGAAEESSIAQAKALFDTNLFGAIRMMRAVLPRMRDARSGRIVNVSSVFGFMPGPFMALYVSSKHALEGYSESLDHELRSLGVNVAVVEPAITRTAFDQNMLDPDCILPEFAAARRNLGQAMADGMKVGDDPSVVAEAVWRAASDTRPKLRYPAGKAAGRLALLRRFAPTGVFSKALRSQMRLDR